MKKITSLIVIVIVIVAVLPTTFVYAQTTTTSNTTAANTTGNATTTTTAPIQLVTPSAAAQEIINNTKAECQQAQFRQARCVILVYESPTTVVLNGRVLIFGGGPESRDYYPNPFLWNAVDDFKAQGYTITSIGISGVGNGSSLNDFHVIMSK